ncbi:hypothetical protein TFLX_05393 [Thermoflexales bacterium]|nr:hypothetical protein TFLX_05393 [Thermoflexales bacterium]
MKKRLFVLLLLLASLLTACNTPTPTLAPTPTPTPPPRKTWTIENAGWICFREYDLFTHELGGVFRPKGCFSSTCTRRQEEKVDVELDGSNMALKFVTKFVVLDIATHTPQEQVCSADCNSDEMAFKLADVMTGTYAAMLGDQKMGSLEVPPTFIQVGGICFGEW